MSGVPGFWRNARGKLREGVEIFSGLSDRESKALLLLTFIPAEHGSTESPDFGGCLASGECRYAGAYDRPPGSSGAATSRDFLLS
jgi:hypothetical protein